MLKDQGFNEWASRYERQVLEAKGYPFEGYKDIVEMIMDLIPIRKDTSLLDVGIGTGYISHHLYNKGVSITGIDFSDKMIEIAKSRIEGNFYKQDLNNGLPIELKGKQFDAILSTYVMHHFDLHKKIELILEFKNYLKPNGKIIIGDVAFQTLEDMNKCKKEYELVWDSDELYITMEELLPELDKLGLSYHYQQVSICNGLLIID